MTDEKVRRRNIAKIVKSKKPLTINNIFTGKPFKPKAQVFDRFDTFAWIFAICSLTFTCYHFYSVIYAVHQLSIEELQSLQPSLRSNLTSSSPYILDRVCDPDNDCFLVMQMYTESREGFEAYRMMQYEFNENLTLSMAKLITPKLLTPRHLDHSEWRMEHRQLMFSYNLLQIAAGFMLGSLSFTRSHESQRVLQIGMGGGTATSYLATLPMNLTIDVVELAPEVYEAAKKWFEFPDADNIRVHIEDGIDFAKRAASQGITYDSLILDVSSNAPNDSFVCPHVTFHEDDVIEALSKVVGDNGVLSLNLFMPHEQLKLQEFIIERYSAHFRSCFGLKYNEEGQKFLLCSNRENFNWDSRRDEIIENTRAFDRELHLMLADFLLYYNQDVKE